MTRLRSAFRRPHISPAQLAGPLSPAMREALAASAAASLQLYRHAYASRSSGPFFMQGTIEGLAQRGLVAIDNDADAGLITASVTRAGRARLQIDQAIEGGGDVVQF